MASVDLARSECYFTNVIKDLDNPLAKYISFSKHGAQVTPAGHEYIQMLKNELEHHPANVIVAVGNVALYALTNRFGITKWRGSILESTLLPGRKIIPIFHPATVIPPKNVYTNKHLITTDLGRVVVESRFPHINHPEIHIQVEPTFDAVLKFIKTCIDYGEKGWPISIDIEVIGPEIDCISLAYDSHNTISIPFRSPQGDYFSIEQEANIWLLLAALIEDPIIPICGQNIIFDLSFIFRKYGIAPQGKIYCTMVAQKILYPDFSVGLDFITSLYTNIPYYKADGKQWMKMAVEGGWKKWWTYNAMDSVVCAIAMPQQITDLQEQGNLEVFDRKMAITPALMYMSEKGIKVNTAGLLDKKKDIETEIKEVEQQLWDMVGYQLNHNSPKQLMHYFYEEKKIQPYRKRTPAGWVPTTDYSAMVRLATTQNRPEARLIIKLRKLSKMLGTYLNLSKISSDSRLRCQYKPHGTDTGRYSSSEDIFGEGMNQQNIPHDILTYLLPDEGYIYYAFDLSQIENRIVAYVGRVLAMIKAFEANIDLHRMTAGLVFSKSPDDISDEKGSTMLGGGEYSERDFGKKANHCKLRTADVLTPAGWVSIEDAYITNAKIAQWEAGGRLTFVTPSKWFISTYTGEIHTLSNQRIFQEATPEHRMPIEYKGKTMTRLISKYPASGEYRAPLSGILEHGTVTITPMAMRLLVAFQADGSWNHKAMRFTLTKKRKVDRLKWILESLNINYNDNFSGIDIPTNCSTTEFMHRLLGRSKLFGSWLLELTQESLLAFLEELPYWDGYLPKSQYFTTVKQNAEWVQTIAHVCGKAANISFQDNSETSAFGDKMVYILRIRDTAAPSTAAIRRTIRYVENEPILCPTVPSSFFMVRENGIVSITGNSLNYDFGAPSFALKYEITQKDAKWIVERYHAVYPEIRGTYHATIRDQLAKNRTLTNLMGRKRVFLGKWEDSLFKAAYAHIPQSTVADVIDERAIKYIWENRQTLFPELQLMIQIHDSVGFQLPLSIPWERHAEILLKIHSSMTQSLSWNDREFVVPADLTMGFTLNKRTGKDIKDRYLPRDPSKLAVMLADKYKELTHE